jgi:thiolase-like protein
MPTDVQTAIFYDHFTPFTLIQLEELAFCGWGEAKDFIADFSADSSSLERRKAAGKRLPAALRRC